MLFRYGTTEDGSVKKKAHIYTREEHGIDVRLVDADALWVVRRLRKEGFHAYIVGGAVRDLLLGRTPKDFDIATDAHPQQIRRLFRSARIIGRRFRLVHVYCSREKYIEVTTFRSRSAVGTAEHAAHHDQNNLFGTMEEDAVRRDFTINALYYCPIDEQLIDYVGGLPDMRQKRLRTLVPAEVSFGEDPVRMIRAVKYASLAGFPIPLAMGGLIRRMRESVLVCSRERVTEEVYKILTSGNAEGIMELSSRLRLFETMFPALAAELRESRKKLSEHPLGQRLRDLDARTRDGAALDRNDMFGFLFRDLLLGRAEVMESDEPDLFIQQFLRSVSEPLFPSRKDLAVAAASILAELRPHHKAHHAPVQHGHPGNRAERETTGATPRKRRRRRGGRGRRRPGTGGGGEPTQAQRL